jgi:hypothetical protein
MIQTRPNCDIFRNEVVKFVLNRVYTVATWHEDGLYIHMGKQKPGWGTPVDEIKNAMKSPQYYAVARRRKEASRHFAPLAPTLMP